MSGSGERRAVVLSRGYALATVATSRPVMTRWHPLLELRSPSMCHRDASITSIGLVTPPRTLRVCRSVERRRCASRFSRASRRDERVESPSGPSTELRLLQSLTVVGGRASCLGMPRGASPEVSGSSSTTQLSSPLNPGLPRPVRSVLRVSHPLDGFLLDSLPGLVSCRSAHGVPGPTELFPRPEP
jgi:hypothetical protein